MANRDYGKNCSTAVKKMADGGAVGESVGFWERIKAGNIDAPGSEAYNRWGNGAKMDAELDAASDSFKNLPTKTGSSAPAASPSPASPAKVNVEQEAASSSGLRDKMPADEGEKSEAPKAESLTPVGTRAVNRVNPSGKSFGAGLASGYQSMAETKRLKAANTKATPNETSNETNRLAEIPKSPKSPHQMSTYDDPKQGMYGTPRNMANGGMVGGGRYYGKK